jgi:DeoR/GlpR family transcriptional regulator of sugar metabolism
MISKLRHRKLLQFLEERKEATIESLAAELGISSATVRRDLKELDDLGLVRRLQGGAVAVSSISKEAPFSVRETEHSREKKLIAQYAANFVKDGDVLFLDGGTTTEFLIPEIAARKGLTVITCGINIASILTRYPSIHGIMLGGEIHAESQTVAGLISQRLFDSFSIRCNIAFIAAAGVDAIAGATNRMIDRIPLKQRGMQISSQSILLADGSKFGRVSFGKIAEVEDFTHIITDSSAPLKEIEAIQARGGDILTAYDHDEA